MKCAAFRSSGFQFIDLTEKSTLFVFSFFSYPLATDFHQAVVEKEKISSELTDHRDLQGVYVKKVKMATTARQFISHVYHKARKKGSDFDCMVVTAILFFLPLSGSNWLQFVPLFYELIKNSVQ